MARRITSVLKALAILCLILAGMPTPAAHAASTWTVESLADGPADAGHCPGSNCTLRDAIAAASSGDKIIFSVTGVITLNQGELQVLQSLGISGPGADLLTIDADGAGRVMLVGGGPYTVSLQGMTFTGGNETTNDLGGGIDAINVTSLTLEKMVIAGNTAGVPAGFNFGGGLYLSNGTFTITDSEISGNSTASGTGTSQGGGIYLTNGTLNMTNVTLSGNQAIDGDGGGLMVDYAATANLTNVTIAGNNAGDVGGGLFVKSPATAVNIHNTLIGDNTAGGDPDCYTSTVDITSQDYNLIEDTSGCTVSGSTAHDITGVAPLVGTLQDNGGPTQTMALLGGSPAIDAADDSGCPGQDQRGVSRPFGLHCDMGAYEHATRTISGNAGVGAATLTYDVNGPQVAVADSGGLYSLTVPLPWTGTVTPHKTGFFFTPASRSYTDVMTDMTNQNYVAAELTPKVLAAYPAPNSTACLLPNVGVSLWLTNGVRTPAGSFDPSTVTLKLDNVVKTGSAVISQDVSYPASKALILYKPPSSLSAGMHNASFTYPTLGGPVTYNWNFNLSNIACPTSAQAPNTLQAAPAGNNDTSVVQASAPLESQTVQAAPVDASAEGTALDTSHQRLRLIR